MSVKPLPVRAFRRVAAGLFTLVVLDWILLGTGVLPLSIGQALILPIGIFTCIRLLLRARVEEERSLRLFFLLAGSALALFMGGVLAQAVLFEIYKGRIPTPSLADVFTVPAYICALAAVALMLRGTGASHLRTLIDGVMVASGVFLFSWVVLIKQLLSEPGQGLLTVAILTLYPILDVVALTAVLLAAVRRSTFGPYITGGIMSALAVLALGDSVYLTANFNNSIPFWVATALWTTSTVCDLLGSLGPAAVSERRDERPTLGAALLPYLTPVIIGIVCLGYWQAGQRPDAVMMATIAVALLCLFARQALQLIDNLRLNQNLERTVAELRASERLLRESELRLHHAAHHDPLTGLANRRLFYDRLHDAVKQPDAYSAVLVLDLDDFKVLNDTHGHHAGDDLLVEVAARLRAATRPGDVVARLGGDEFAVLLQGSDADGARRVAERVRAALLDATGRRPAIPVSIGFADLGAVADEEEALRRADEAMYRCKRQGKSGMAIYALG